MVIKITEAKKMGKKLKMFGALTFIGSIGFLLGIASNFIYSEALPILMKVFPQISITWVMWGLVGAFVSVTCSLIYAYLT